MKASLMIAIAAMFMVASFAGVAIIDDEADAAGETGTVMYIYDNQSYSDTVSAGTVVLKNFAEVFPTANGKHFLGWGLVNSAQDEDPSSTVVAGSSISVEAGSTIYVKAMFVTYSVTFTGPENVLLDKMDAISASPDVEITLPEFIDNDTPIAPEGTKFIGWTIDGVVYTAGAEYTVTKTVTAVATFTDGYTITLVAGDIKTDVKYPIDSEGFKVYVPSLQGNTFAGWYDEEGVLAFNADGSLVDSYKITSDLVLIAKFNPDLMTVTLMTGDVIYDTVTVLYGDTCVVPYLPEGYVAWAADAEGTISFDFNQPITSDTTIYAVKAVPSDVFTVTFAVDGKVIATYASNSVTLPDTPSKAGYLFKGWAINNAVIADPVNYAFTSDTQFDALFQAIDVTTYTVTVVLASGETYSIPVESGDVANLPSLDEGKVWALGDVIFNPDTAIATDITLKEVDEYNTVSFSVNGVVYDAYSQEVRYGSVATMPAKFVFPAGYDGWDFDFSTPITEDITIHAAEIPAPVEEPAFYKTTSGQVAIVLVAFVLLAFGYMTYTNMFGLKDKLFGWRNKKE